MISANHAKELQEKLAAAVLSGRYMIAVFHRTGNTMHLFRHGNLNTSDMERAVALLSEDVMKQTDFDFLKALNLKPQPPDADTPGLRAGTEPGADRPSAGSVAEESAGDGAATADAKVLPEYGG